MPSLRYIVRIVEDGKLLQYDSSNYQCVRIDLLRAASLCIARVRLLTTGDTHY
jgi:hypothetical protein